jgi:hypothetical protein
MRKSFEEMSRAERAVVVRELMEAGSSYGKAAHTLETTKGAVAGICRDYDIPSKNPPGFDALPKSSSGVVLKLSPPGPTQCEARVDGYQCAYLKESDSDYCGLPTHQALAKKRRA